MSCIAERPAHLADIEQERDVHSPFATRTLWHLLPFELLELIFLMADENSRLTFPTNLSLVCSEWRSIANIIPRLWTRIKICDARGICTARIWLTRSKTVLPITVELVFTSKGTKRDLGQALELVGDQLGRIVDLDVKVDGNSQFIEVIEGLNKPAPLLQAFKLDNFRNNRDYDFFAWDGIAKCIFGGGETPNLQMLQLISISSPWPEGLTKNLAELVLLSPPEENPIRILQLLESAPALSRIHLRQSTSGTPSPAFPDRIITLPALVHAQFRGYFLYPLALVLQFLNLPKLQYLHISCGHTRGLHRVPSIDARPFPSLHILRLSWDENDHAEADVQILLRRCYNLKELHVNTPTPLYTLLHHSTLAMCPHIVKLQIIGGFRYSRIRQSLPAFLESRLHSETMPSIEMVTFQHSFSFSKVEAEALLTLVTKEVNYGGQKFSHLQ